MREDDSRVLDSDETGRGEVAVCLCASFLGAFAHAGFVQGLSDAGVRIGRIAGSSAGGIVAGMLGTGCTPGAIVTRLLRFPVWRVWINFRMPYRLLRLLLQRPRAGLIAGEESVRFFRRLVGRAELGGTGVRVEISSLNLATGSIELHSAGDAARCMAASCAVPGLVQPVRLGETLHLDAGILDHAPCMQWADCRDVETIIIHTIRADAGNPRAPRLVHAGILGLLATAHLIDQEQMLARRIEALREAGKRVWVFETCARRPGTFTGAGGYEALRVGRETGREAARQLLPSPHAGFPST